MGARRLAYRLLAPPRMSLRRRARHLVIKAAAATALDAAARTYVRHRACSRRASLVRVLFLHGTPAASAAGFRRQLVWLRDHFRVIDFPGFKQLLTEPLEPAAASGDGRPALLLTFDDGLVSNFEVAAPLLEEMGMRGVFFIVPAFSTIADPAEAERFFRQRIRARPTVPFEPAMTPAQVRDLAARGHTIGNHTWSHARLADAPVAELGREILESADRLEAWTGQPVEAFAWPFVWNAITPEAHRLARQRHAFCFSPCAGTIDPAADSPALIWRTNAEASRSFDEFRFQCSGLADVAAAARRRRLSRVLADVPPADRLEARTTC